MFNILPLKKKKQSDGFNNDLAEFKNEMNKLVDPFMFKSPFDLKEFSIDSSGWVPSVEVTEKNKEVIVKAELPGMDSKDIEVMLNGKYLTIKGKKQQEHEDKDVNYHRVELSYGTFQRVIELPSEVDESSVDASYKKGILKIAIKKLKESNTKKIDIKVK